MPKFQLKNTAGTVLSLLSNAATTIREWTLPDKSGAIALLDDLDAFQAIATVPISGATTLTGTAFGKLHLLSGASDYTIALPAASGNAGRTISFRGTSGLTAIVTIDGNASETINSIIVRQIAAGGAFTLYCDGSNWQVISEIPSMIPYSPTMAGIASTTSLQCSYKLIGKVLQLKWVIIGTGDAGTTLTISLPANMVTAEYVDGMVRVQNNASVAAGRYVAGAGVSIVTINATVSGGAWTASTARQVYGQLTVGIQ